MRCQREVQKENHKELKINCRRLQSVECRRLNDIMSVAHMHSVTDMQLAFSGEIR